MNKELKHRIFDIPQNVLDIINHTVVTLEGKHVAGIQRAKKLLTDKKVKYGQLKRIIHDLENTDKIKERTKYNLYGGDKMLEWASKFLDGERELIKSRRDSKKKSNEIAGIDGIRKNTHLKKHNKKFDFRIPINLIKSNSHKSTITPLMNLNLNEEINKIKKLINY